MAAYPTGRATLSRHARSARPAIVRCTNPLPRLPAAARILVVRLGAVGDVVRTLPAVSALRAAYPHARLTWLVEPPSRSVVEAQPWVDDILVFPRPALRRALAERRLARAAGTTWAFLRELRARRFDLVVDFHAILKTGVISRASGAPRRASYAPPYGREGAWLFANGRARLSAPRASRFERNAALIEFLGAAYAPSATPLRVPAAALHRVGARLGDGAAPVVMHPSTSDATPHKRWTVEGYAAVARALARDAGLGAVVTVGPARDDRALAEAVVAASGGAARLAPETPSLADLAALLSLGRLYVGGDTGPMHIASLVGTPVVQILGPTDPVENAPYPGTAWRRVRVSVGCNPCRRGCAAATCMRVVRPEAVVAAARELLAVEEAG